MPLISSSKSRKANSAHARKQMPFNYLMRHRLFHVVWCPGRLKLDGENYSVSFTFDCSYRRYFDTFVQADF